MEFYQGRKETFGKELKKLNRRYNIISLSRLIMAVAFLVLGYYSLQPGDSTIQYALMAACVVEFLLLMKRHGKVHQMKFRAAALLKINEDEIAYLEGKAIPFEDGAEFIDFKHSYSHDLDIFGSRSLFHNLNRTQTYKGGDRLAELLKGLLPQDEIKSNQEAIKELAAKPEFRQEIMALGKMNSDGFTVYSRLLSWANERAGALPNIAYYIAIISSAMFIMCMAGYFITANSLLSTVAGCIFGFNLLFLMVFLKTIKTEMKDASEIHDIIHHYGLIIEQIENESFTSEKLKSLQQSLVTNSKKASTHIKKLANLFARLDSINNGFGAILFNGILLFHFHSLKALLAWKQQHAQSITLWLDTIAEAEALSSLGNLYYNNPDFTFPKLNTDHVIAFSQLAHPLLKRENRIGNDIRFDSDFMILTGSNMSGKSTFLRSLGVNMVLAGAGAPVCASHAVLHPLPVLVSMRLSDSLAENESYFFAEVKRLKYIMNELKGKRSFVLLDEILKGTNSDDKHSGTVKVIEKMLDLQAIGAIATHDIEVCSLTDEYPGKLVNRCFEAQIVNNELYFDYRLRDGICRNKSATFLMEKMGIIGE